MLEFILPRETVLITTRGRVMHFGKEVVKDNVMSTDWHMPLGVSHFAISVPKSSLTAQLIQESNIFVVNFVRVGFADSVRLIGKSSGHTIDKFAAFSIAKEEAEGVDCCRLKDAVAYVSGHVVEQHLFEDYILFAGKVVATRVLVSGMKRLFHLGGGDFGTVD
jgi:flavin reductase (DIM6/NTAB) family NADH-FMN oxidoreductase RutF